MGIAAGITAAFAVTGLAVAPAMAATAPSSTVGIFADNLQPRTAADSDRSAVELGIRFSPDKSGSVTGIQYYQGSRAAGVNKATLWTADGKVLAQVSFASTQTAGWRTIPLTKPVALTAGSTYVASYNAPKGQYPVIQKDLLSARTQNGFTLKAGAGVYRYGTTSKVPTSTYQGSNYLVDVVYAPSTTSGGTTNPAPTTPAPAPTTPSKPTPAPTQPAPAPTQPAPAPTQPAPTQPAPAPTTPAPAPDSGAKSGFPTASNTGLPANWKPAREVTGTYRVSTPGAVVEDIKITNGTILVTAPNVTLRRIQGVNATVSNYSSGSCFNGMTVADSSFTRSGPTNSKDEPVIGPGGYTAKNVFIDGAPEGFRVGGKSNGCGPVTTIDSFVRIVSPDVCNDWHGDGIQGYDGNSVTVRNTTIFFQESGCYGTAPFFYPSGQGNTSVDIDGLLVSGGGYTFRNGMAGSIRNLNVVENKWGYGPIEVRCSAISSWSANIVRLDSAGQPTTVRSQACNTERG